MLNGVKATKELLNALDNVKKPKTNAERFRAMSDEEQQKFVRRFLEIEDFADWLQQPSEIRKEDSL